MRFLLFALFALASFFTPALAQDVGDQPAAPVAALGISVSGQVSVLFQCEPEGPVAVLRTAYADRMLGDANSPTRIMAGMDLATRAGLMQAFASGADRGRADVVAMAYAIGGVEDHDRDWSPIGIYVYTTEFSRDGEGQATFTSRIEFHPDTSRITVRLN